MQELSQYINLLLKNTLSENVESNLLTITEAGENMLQQEILNNTTTIIETTDAFVTAPAVQNFLVSSEYAVSVYSTFI